MFRKLYIDEKYWKNGLASSLGRKLLFLSIKIKETYYSYNY